MSGAAWFVEVAAWFVEVVGMLGAAAEGASPQSSNEVMCGVPFLGLVRGSLTTCGVGRTGESVKKHGV